MFNKVVTMLAGTSALLCATQLPTTTSAAHLKVHVENHHGKDLKHHHQKGIFVDDEDPLLKQFLVDHYSDIFAVCVYHHPSVNYLFYAKRERYSVAFFDQQGEVLKGGKFCDRDGGIADGTVKAIATNPGGWSTDVIDDQSVCYRFETETQDSTTLITSYTCED